MLSDEELKIMMEHVLTGQKISVHLDDIPGDKPPWFDETKFLAGQHMAEKYYGGILFCHLISLTMLVYSPQVLKPLMYTGRSETPKKSYRRYISTSVHVMSWYRGDVWKDGNLARKSIQRVRKYHSDTAKDVNASETRPLVDKIDVTSCEKPLYKKFSLIDCLQSDLSNIRDCPFLDVLDDSYKNIFGISSNPVPYFNQLDMSGTQFAFIGLIILYPEKFGMKRATVNELEGFIHMWRCFGWILGIEDRFNFCRFDNLVDSRRWTRYFLEELVMPMLKRSLTAEYEHMGRAVALGARYYFPFSYEALYLYIAWVLGITVPKIEERVSEKDRRGFRRMSFLFSWLFNLPFGNLIVNAITYVQVRIIVNPPFFWSAKYRPPPVLGLKNYWK